MDLLALPDGIGDDADLVSAFNQSAVSFDPGKPYRNLLRDHVLGKGFEPA